MTRLASIVTAVVMCMSNGCATIIQGTTQSVQVHSEPQGAQAKISNGMTVTTPGQVDLKRNTDYIVTISKDGYQTQTIPLNSVLSGWLAGNIIFGGIIGGGVDLASGAAYTLAPENIYVTLTPLRAGESARAAPTEMTTLQKLEALEDLYAQGVVTDNEYEASKAKLNQDLKAEIQE